MISWTYYLRERAQFARTYTHFETPVKLHTQTLTNTMFSLKWYEKLAMSVCKKMIENVPDDLNVYSILFYFILVVVMVNMIKKSEHAWARNSERERERAPLTNYIKLTRSLWINSTRRRLLLLLFLALRLPLRMNDKFNDEYAVCLSQTHAFRFLLWMLRFFFVDFHRTIVLYHPSSLYKSFDVSNMVRICVFNEFQPAASVKKKTKQKQLIDL